ncbi:gfo/Idh/MocA family oxidoreductase [Cohnella faecalis]|uniref:Gfo/Idh/MocA family oxidoreductase n=2 Tax=Cohnella faecalis TaxID=2315694 RepID=A0A398CV86_9BACL|nr:gfo/Idh/MocA family oxidoreductase [Cohnella faecalis]
MGTIHADRYMSMPEAELVAVCDINEQAAASLGRTTGAPHFTSFQEMLEQAKPDAVSIAVPTYLHVPLVKQAAENGVHVICEKPIALTSEEAAKALRICEEYGVRLFVGHVVRFFPQYVQLAEKVELFGGDRGGVYHAKRAGSHPALVQPWFKETDKSGGVILDLMIHDIDYILGTFGEAVEVYAFNRVTDDLDYAAATFRFRNGTIAQLEAFWGYPGPFHTAFEYASAGGIVRADSSDAESLRVRSAAPAGSGSAFVETPQSVMLQDPYYRELRHFLECLRSGEKPIVTAQDALLAIRWAEAALKSVRSGLPEKPSEEEDGLR